MGQLTSIKSSDVRFADQMRSVKPIEPEPAPRTCTICGQSVPPLLTIIGRYVPSRCACEREADTQKKSQKEHNARMKQMAEHTYHGWLGEEWMNPQMVRELGTKKFETYDPVRQQEYNKLKLSLKYITDVEKQARIGKTLKEFEMWRRTWHNALDLAKAFANDPSGVLLLYGPYGTGKTHLLAAICNALRHHDPAISALFVVTPKFFQVVYDRMQHNRDEWQLIRQACTTKLLVLDDLDKSGPKEFRQEIFFQIIDERITSHLPIAISTNKMENLQNYIGEAAYSRLMAGCKPVELAGGDYRANLMQ